MYERDRMKIDNDQTLEAAPTPLLPKIEIATASSLARTGTERNRPPQKEGDKNNALSERLTDAVVDYIEKYKNRVIERH